MKLRLMALKARTFIILIAVSVGCGRANQIDPRDLPQSVSPMTAPAPAPDPSPSPNPGPAPATGAFVGCSLGNIRIGFGTVEKRYYTTAQLGGPCGYGLVTCNSDGSIDYDNYGTMDVSGINQIDPTVPTCRLRTFNNHDTYVTGSLPFGCPLIVTLFESMKTTCP